MPLPTQNVEVLIQGLAQSVDPNVHPHGALVVADNVEFDKSGSLNKRRGYRRVSLVDDINNTPIAEVFSAVAVFDDELVLFSDNIYSIVDARAGVDGTSAILRGPSQRGAYRLRTIVGVGIAELDTVSPP